MKNFDTVYKRVVESGTWIRTGKCSVANSERGSTQWCPGQLELERQGVEANTESGTLTISYLRSSKVVKSVINLAEVKCCFVDRSEPVLYPSYDCLVILSNSKFKIKFSTEEEMDDWLATINISCGDLHGINGRTATFGPLLYCLTNRGLT